MSLLTQENRRWSSGQIVQWFQSMTKHPDRDYHRDIIGRLNKLPANTHTLKRYGAVIAPDNKPFPLYSVTVGDVGNANPNILITAGVHGYEPSGIEAALEFLEKDALKLSRYFNFVVFPCISPWSYEVNHRWNWRAEDPNRCFARKDVPDIDECRHFMDSIERDKIFFDVALDMHETPDRDIALRKERADRFGTDLESYWQTVPQGFYLMMTKPEEGCIGESIMLGRSIIKEVSKVSPIAPEGKILGKENHGGMTLSPAVPGTMRAYLQNHADQIAITEVYPDHKDMGPDAAIKAQLSVLRGALKFIR